MTNSSKNGRHFISLYVGNQICGQVTTFHATTKSRMVCKEVARITERSIDEGQSFSWEGQQFVIPPVPPSYLTGCNIIDIRYILQVSCMKQKNDGDVTIFLSLLTQTHLWPYPPKQVTLILFMKFWFLHTCKEHSFSFQMISKLCKSACRFKSYW